MNRSEPPFISYAQNSEDVVLWRALGEYGPGFYIDVGAADPVAESVTKAFYDAGWRGINLEPMPGAYQLLRDDRERDVNLRLAAESGPREAEYFSIDGGNGLSSGVPDLAQRYREQGSQVEAVSVDVTTLATICHQFVQTEIHFLKIDVEGMEAEVLAGADFKSYRPWVVLVEATEPNRPIPAHGAWEPSLFDAGYEFTLFDGLNRFYVAAEKAQLLGHRLNAPANVLDNFVRAVDLERIEGLTTRIAATEQQLQESKVDAGSLSEQLDDAFQVIYEGSRRISGLGIDLQTAEERARALEQVAATIESDLARTADELTAVYASNSWRATKPLRAASRIVLQAGRNRARSDER
jgi:FkbM family methyltransferase